MIEGTPTLDVDATDDFWYYTADTGPVSVATATGPWVAATAGLDPNGVPGWRVTLSGPAATPTGVVLGYGANRLRVQLGSGQVVAGGSVYAGTTGLWADPYDPAVYSTVVTGAADTAATVPTPIPFEVDLALRVATTILGSLTANLIHPPGSAVEEFRGQWPLHRVSFTHAPITHIDAVTRIDWEFNETAVDVSEWTRVGRSLIFRPRFGPALCGGPGLGDVIGYSVAPYLSRHAGDLSLSGYTGGVGTETLRVGYRFGSTVTSAARQAMLYFARQLWLQTQGQDCELPERTTSITREGVSYTVMATDDYLDKGHTGIPKVDLWVASANPSAGAGRTASARANRASGVYTPDSPPGVVTSYRTTI